jgi:hypothetical protein
MRERNALYFARVADRAVCAARRARGGAALRDVPGKVVALNRAVAIDVATDI